MFHSAALKLTTWYLAIIMAISIIFSLSLYHVSSADLGRNVNRQINYFNNFLAPDDSERYGVLRQSQLENDLHHLKASLVLFNIMVLVFGGAASYWLARRTLQPIEEALHAQARFASDASHELRTPLAVIQAENEVALRNKNITKTQAVDALKSNLEEISKLKALSEGLLRLANGGSGALELVPVDIKEVAELAVNRHTRTAQAKKIAIANTVSAVKVKGDKDSLVELISIFVDNAIKYSGPGKKVTLSSRRQGKNILIKISDQGQGIKKDELPLIFDRFYRADTSRNKNSAGGYGLGLAIAQKITDAHHGYIEVTSAVGKGTSFTVVLPAA